jgi:hypothetical protein
MIAGGEHVERPFSSSPTGRLRKALRVTHRMVAVPAKIPPEVTPSCHSSQTTPHAEELGPLPAGCYPCCQAINRQSPAIRTRARPKHSHTDVKGTVSCPVQPKRLLSFQRGQPGPIFSFDGGRFAPQRLVAAVDYHLRSIGAARWRVCA